MANSSRFSPVSTPAPTANFNYKLFILKTKYKVTKKDTNKIKTNILKIKSDQGIGAARRGVHALWHAAYAAAAAGPATAAAAAHAA